MKVSYLEIYNEELSDLLDGHTASSLNAPTSQAFAGSGATAAAAAANAIPHNKKLMLCDSAKGVVCHNLTEMVCQNSDDVFTALRKGISARQVLPSFLISKEL